MLKIYFQEILDMDKPIEKQKTKVSVVIKTVSRGIGGFEPPLQ